VLWCCILVKCCAGKLVCRYLFRRCDNEPAPWSAADTGDGAWQEDDLPEDAVEEITRSKEEVSYPGSNLAWNFDTKKGKWRWIIPPPTAAPKTCKNPPASPAEAAARLVRAVRHNQGHVCQNF
jgi:hypothetical protein